MNTDQYFKQIEEGVRSSYVVAEEARKKGFDPKTKVEVPIATTLAERVVGLISTIYPQINDPRIVKRILALEKEYGQLDAAVSFKIAEEVAKEKFCKFTSLMEAIDAGIRLGFAYNTLGVVSSPIEGFTEVKVEKTRDGKEYFIPYFSGPIRSAGTTASCMVLILIDYLRETFGYAKYDPDEKEIKRYITEVQDYHDRVTNLQYLPSEQEVEFLAKNLPIQIAGDPTEKREVSNYKDLERVDSDFIRGGMCLIFAEGLAQKAQKGLRILRGLQDKGFKISDWEFLQEYVDKYKLAKKDDSGKKSVPTYIKDLVAGRPVFGHPSKSGGFRFRYGRSRVCGFSATSIHPATMFISDDFLSTGNQLKIEKPTKGCVVTGCDEIDGPIVKFNDGSVKKMRTAEEAKGVYKDVEEIIYFGDLLFPLGDVINRNYDLLKPGYVEEWWELELRKVAGKIKIDKYNVSFEDAIGFSEQYKVPLHPEYIYYWTEISFDDFLSLLDWLGHAIIRKKIILPYNKTDAERFQKGKRALEILGVEHDVSTENVVVDEQNSLALFANLGLDVSIFEKEEGLIADKIKEILEKIKGKSDVLESINEISDYKIKNKAGTFIGARMGRPEKAKLRKLIGSPNVLFPVSDEGGRLRSVHHAVEVGSIKAEFPIRKCKKCDEESIYPICERCGDETVQLYYCRECGKKLDEPCEEHERTNKYQNTRIDIKHYFETARKQLGLMSIEVPALIKGVRGTSNEDHIPENLAKGFLRAKFNLKVNKDGTVRYDATELPLTHFKAKEIGTGVEKLKELGYDKDIDGKELVNEDQVLELKPHDVVLPACPDSEDEKADDVFFNIANFIDDLLVRFYKLPKFYNLKKKSDIVGHLVSAMAPHNCACVVGRIIGFSKTQGLFASPYIHAAMRRDCFDYNTYIPIKQKGFWRNVKIGELVEELNPQRKVDNFGTKEEKVKGYFTLGFGKKIKEVKVNNFTKHSKISMIEIKTALGKKIKVTENHKFLVDGKIKIASDLSKGDKVPLVRRIDIKSNNLKEINLLDFLSDENLMIRGIKDIVGRSDVGEKEDLLEELRISKKQFQNFNIRDSYPVSFVLGLNKNLKEKIFNVGKIAAKRDSVEVPIKIKLYDDLLEVIGLYVAEGYSRSVGGKKGLNQVYISSFDKEIRELIRKTIFKYFGLNPSERKKDRVTFSSKVLYLFFTKILEAGCLAREKRVPYMFLDFPLDKLGSFLRGYFEGDGSAEKNRKKISCDSVSEGLLQDLEFCLARFGIFTKRYEYEKEPGERLKEFYVRKNRMIPKFKITKLIIGSDFVDEFKKIGFLSKRKKKIIEDYKSMNPYGMKIDYDENFVYDSIVEINNLSEEESYCLNVESKNHLVVANSILNKQCDGDEAAVMLLMDMLINFSRAYLPSHRGGTQDAPLVLNVRVRAGEVDDQILDFGLVSEYPLELYEKAEQGKHSSEIEIEMVKQRLKEGKNPFININFTHSTGNFNDGVVHSSYKSIPNMQEKVQRQMGLVEKLRAADTSDVARLIIEKHFIRDIRGNLRKFSQQQFRCVKCNSKYRRPPLAGKCVCGGKIIFTISHGGIIKYLEPALNLAETYNVPAYLKQNLKLIKMFIENIFGREKEKQESIEKWF